MTARFLLKHYRLWVYEKSCAVIERALQQTQIQSLSPLPGSLIFNKSITPEI